MIDLFLCCEGDSYVANKVCKKMREISNKDIIPFYATPWHSVVNRMQEDGAENSINLLSIYTKKDIEEKLQYYNDHKSFKNIDKDIDKELINQLILHINLDQQQIVDISNRPWYKGIMKTDMILFIDFMIGYVNDVIDKYKPETIYSLSITEYLTKLISLIAKKRNIKFRSITNTRFGEYILLTDTFGEKVNTEYNSINHEEPEYSEAKEAIKSFLSQKSLLINAEKKFVKDLEVNPIKYIIFSIYSATRFLLKTLNQRRTTGIKLPKRNSGFMKIINPSLLQSYLYKFKLIFKLFKSKITSEVIIKPENYFYLPLAYTIENISASTAGSLLSDFEIINKIRIFADPFTNIIVKEHRSMLDQRPNIQKKYLKKLKFNSITYIGDHVSSNKKYSSLDLILNSKGVIVQSGTTGLEAMLLNKPTLIFGNPIYSQFIPKTIDPENSSELFNFFQEPQSYVTSRDYLINYVSIAIKYGIKLNISEISSGLLSSQKIEELAKYLLS